jgi:pimeloyl-ACP methyl ester carboxylesterase
MCQRNSSAEFLRAIPIYLLIVAGIHDSIIPIAVSKQVAELSAKVVYRPLYNSGHMGMMEDKIDALKAIREFMGVCLAEPM